TDRIRAGWPARSSGSLLLLVSAAKPAWRKSFSPAAPRVHARSRPKRGATGRRLFGIHERLLRIHTVRETGRTGRMKIRAAVLEEFGRPLEVQDVDLAEPRAGEVLVRLVACGVCHTDLYTASGADPSGYAPAVLGHEGAGVVERVGEGVASL